ncbi:MAG: nitrate reductase [Chloroflexi bacterium]|jgi:nitrate reductase gamma subunit|nr:nitrate reductase [Chloroflexota bacterium]
MQETDLLWTLVSLVIIGLSYFAIIVFVFGLLSRLWEYLRTPQPLPGAVTPAPTSNAGAAVRVAKDVLIFPSLWKADKFLWAGSWLFHVTLALVLFRHLRYFTYPVPSLVLKLQPVALTIGYIFGITILYLFWRRLALPRTLYVSNLPDYFALALLGGIAATGIIVSYWTHVNLVDVKAFVIGLLTLHPTPPPNHPLFLLHFMLVLLLMIYFPFSKLLHAGGIFFSPARNQPFQVQEAGKRYVNPWDTPES